MANLAAVMEEARSAWRGLEPAGRGHELLIVWGQHRRGGNDTHSPVASGSWSEPLDKCHDDEPHYVVLIDDVFRGLVLAGCEHTVEISKRFYLEYPRYDFWEVAAKVYRTEGFVRLTLRGVVDLVELRVPE